MLGFPVILTPDDNDTLLVTSPAFPELVSFGDDREQALAHAREAIEEAIGARMSASGDLPFALDPQAELPGCADAVVRVSPLTSIKALLYVAARSHNVTRAELARRLNWKRERVDRLFRLDHRSRLDQLEAAFKVLGQEMVIDVRDAA